jgi:chromosome segregation ATPase
LSYPRHELFYTFGFGKTSISPIKTKKMNARQGLTIAVVILLLLLLGAAYWGFTAHTANKSLEEQNSMLNTQLSDLNSLKANLEAEVDSLEQAYSSLAEENESLQGSLADAQKNLAAKEAALRKAQKQSAGTSNNLKAQIEDLLAAKASLELAIGNLQAENDSLRMVTGQLTEDLATARSQNDELANLNATIQEEIKRLTLANFKASAFRVEVERNSPKATAKARKAKRVLVSFDLMGVNKEYQKVRPLYLVITDDKGTPIKAENPIQAKVNVNGQEMDIQAVKEQRVNVQENQRLSFTHDLEDKLKRGFYRVAVYTDVGLLGAASFRLQ